MVESFEVFIKTVSTVRTSLDLGGEGQLQPARGFDKELHQVVVFSGAMSGDGRKTRN